MGEQGTGADNVYHGNHTPWTSRKIQPGPHCIQESHQPRRVEAAGGARLGPQETELRRRGWDRAAGWPSEPGKCPRLDLQQRQRTLDLRPEGGKGLRRERSACLWAPGWTTLPAERVQPCDVTPRAGPWLTSPGKPRGWWRCCNW